MKLAIMFGLGGNVPITNGCEKVGSGLVIGIGEFVTKDVPEYSIVAGIPAKVIKYRFTSDIIRKMESSGWYNYKPQQLMKYYKLMEKPEEFADTISSETKSDRINQERRKI